MIRAALAFERVGIARLRRGERLLGQVRSPAAGSLAAGTAAGPYAAAMVHNRVARLMAYEVIAAQADGTAADADAAAARIAAVTADQEASDVLVEAIGTAVFDSDPKGATLLNAAVEDYWRYSWAATVAAGSVDIQRSLVAQGALGD